MISYVKTMTNAKIFVLRKETIGAIDLEVTSGRIGLFDVSPFT